MTRAAPTMQITPLQCRLARLATGWSAEQLAAAAGLSAPTVWKFEKGGVSFTTSLQRIIIVLQYAGVEFLPAEERPVMRGEGIRFTPPAVSVVVRLKSDLDETAKQLSMMQAGEPNDDGTLHSIRRAAAARGMALQRLEQRVADLERRISKLIELDG